MADLTSDSLCNICCIHYSCGLRCCALGTDLTSTHGGYLFAKSGGYAWIIAPAATKVCRTWYLRDDAVTSAQNAYGCGDWFVPSRTDLTFGNNCKSFWGYTDTSPYWSSTETNVSNAFFVSNLTSGCGSTTKTTLRCVIAFRIVSY